MDVLITAVGELIWAASCGIINFCVSTGFSALAVFVSFLCVILASAFYRYTTSREEMSFDPSVCPFANQARNGLDKPMTRTSPTTIESSMTTTLPQTTIEESDNVNTGQSLSEIEVHIDENTTDDEGNDDDTSNNIVVDTIEGSEEEIQKQQIANIYRLLNDQNLINNWTTTDFLDQLKMYGLEAFDDDEIESS